MEAAASVERGWLEAILDTLPTATILVERRTGVATYANPAAHRLAGGSFPLGSPEARNMSSGFRAVYPDGRPVPRDELPTIRAARGQRVETAFDWETPAGVKSLLVNAVPLPLDLGGRSEAIVVSFEDVTELKSAERAQGESLALLDSLFEGAPIGLAYFDRELRYVRVNSQLAKINGLPAELHVGKTVLELLPEMDVRIHDELVRVLRDGEPVVDVEFAGALPDAPGEMRQFSCAFYPVHDASGVTTGVGATIIETTARRRAEADRERAHELEREAREAAEEAARRARFLAEASAILDESLDYEATLAAVSRLVVPWLADWCAVDMEEPDGTLRRVATAHVDPEKIELAAEWERRYPTDPAASTGVPNVLRTGRAEIYPEITDEMIVAGARDDEHLEMIRSLGMRSAMIVPMTARGRSLGAITFIAAETGRRYGDDDLLLAGELARRAATSIDNARLYEERSYIARTLQQSLLPPHLPAIAGIELAARYRPVGEGNEVGGDFYDAFEMGPDTWAIVIGDVCGKGADAAALTALVRYTIRALATADKRPSEMLRLLNEAILRQRSDNRFSTVVYARVTVSDGAARVELSSGGHPLPLVLRSGGDTELVGEPGTLLGVVADPTLSDAAVELAPGDALLLYTDGVTEAGAPQRLMTPEDVAAMLERCDATDAAAIAECIESAAVEASGGVPHDDVAVVALRVGD